MISFLKTPEINVLFPKSAKSIVNKSKKKDTAGDKAVSFSDYELSLLKKLENYEIPKVNEEEPKDVSDQKKKKKEAIPVTVKGLKEIKNSLNDNEFLCDLLEDAAIELPQNEIVERNPELEERIEKLKAQQQNRAYESMVRNVDSRRKHTEPEDSIAFQSEST
jgi:hypothetical protein